MREARESNNASRALYPLPFVVPERVVFSVALDCVGNLPAVEVILEFPRSFVKKSTLVKR